MAAPDQESALGSCVRPDGAWGDDLAARRAAESERGGGRGGADSRYRDPDSSYSKPVSSRRSMHAGRIKIHETHWVAATPHHLIVNHANAVVGQARKARWIDDVPLDTPTGRTVSIS